jgi:hypothetical protein
VTTPNEPGQIIRGWLSKTAGLLQDHAAQLFVAFLVVVAAALWRRPSLFVGVLAVGFAAVALIYGLACYALWRRTRAEADGTSLRAKQLMRRNLLLEEALYYSLAAVAGDADAKREAVDRLPPPLSQALRAFDQPRLVQARGLFWPDGVEARVTPLKERRRRIEAELGLDRVEPKVTLSIRGGTSTRIPDDA